MEGNSKRTQIVALVIALVYALLLVELLKKTVFASPYYQRLSDNNAIRRIALYAPRGVFYDRNDKLLASNHESKKYQYVREYPYHELYAHLIGYMGLPNDKTLKDRSCASNAAHNQFVGVYGLEQVFECRLRGIPGARYVMTDARGTPQVKLAQAEPRRGEDIHLTVDTQLQQAAQHTLFGAPGAIIATNPRTGEVLAFYSSPSFDPEAMVRDPHAYTAYASDKAQPLFNRLVSGTYPPGSVVKPIYALGSLEEGLITQDTRITDTGIMKVGGTSFGNWYFLQYGKTEGDVDVSKAIARSNDIFFYTLGIKGGEEKLVSWLERFRYGETDMQDFFAQSAATLPSDDWKQRTVGEPWYLGDTINLAIGQGYLLVTPVQVHASMSSIANSGVWCPFSLELGKRAPCTDMKLNQTHVKVVREGMRRACSTGGTGWPLFDFKVQGKSIPIGCKTGTAESPGTNEEPHAWFTVFAPFDNPTIAITVLLEHGGEGSSVAAPVAKAMLTTYFISR